MSYKTKIIICFLINILFAFKVFAGERAVPEDYSTAIKIELLKLDPDKRYDADIYRLTYSDLISSGLLSSNVDPRTIRLYNQGKEQEIYIEGESDGKFDSNDSLWFYGEPFMQTRFTYQNVYWLVWGKDNGKRAEIIKVNASSLTDFIYRQRNYERNEQHQSKFDVPDPWFFKSYVYANRTKNYIVSIDDLYTASTETANIKLQLYAYKWGSTSPNRTLDILVNGNLVGTIAWSKSGLYELNTSFSSDFLSEGNNTISVRGSLASGIDAAKSLLYLDSISISYPGTTDLDNGQINFELKDSAKQQISFSATDKNATHAFAMKDTSLYKLGSYSYSGNNMKLSVDSALAKNFVVTTESQAQQNVDDNLNLDKVTFADLSDVNNQADYLLIHWSMDDYSSSQSSYYQQINSQINRLLEYREDQGLEVMSVGLSDIYNEFSAGIANPSAIKDFLAYAYQLWKSPSPSYVVLVGDASYDYREDELYDRMGINYSSSAAESYKQVPTHMFKNRDIINNSEIGYTASDDWFVCLGGDDDVFPEMTIGRLPARTADDLEVMIDKIIDFENTDLREEHLNRISLFSGGEYDFDKTSDLIEEMAEGYEVHRLSPAGYVGSSFNQDLREELSNGSLFVNYSGHGAIDLWGVAWEGILDFDPSMWLGMFSSTIFKNTDVDDLNNKSKYQIYTALSCMNGYLLKPTVGQECLAERLLKEEDKGAVAMFASSGVSLPSYQRYMAEGFYDAIFYRGNRTLGAAVIRAKLYLSNRVEEFATNAAQSFMLFGDPALQIPLVTWQDKYHGDTGPGNYDKKDDPDELFYKTRNQAKDAQVDYGSLEDDDDSDGPDIDENYEPRPPVPPSVLKDQDEAFADIISSATDQAYSAYLFDAALASGERAFETSEGVSGVTEMSGSGSSSASMILQSVGAKAKVQKEVRLDDELPGARSIVRAKESRLKSVKKLFRHRKNLKISDELEDDKEPSKVGFWSRLINAILGFFRAILRFVRGIF